MDLPIQYSKEQKDFLEKLITLHNDLTCTYDNKWSYVTKQWYEQGYYFEHQAGTLNTIAKDYKKWKSEQPK